MAIAASSRPEVLQRARQVVALRAFSRLGEGAKTEALPPQVCVPSISRFHGIVIGMFFDDHAPPHFHAQAAGRIARVRIDTLEVLSSDLPRKQLAMIRTWAALHQDELEENWQRARNSETLIQIEPLR
jgi:Domain of unknown function (DUF4160)